MTSQTLDSSIGLAAPVTVATASAVRRRDFLERGHRGGFQLNLDSTQSRSDQVVDPSPYGAEHKAHCTVKNGRQDPKDKHGRAADGTVSLLCRHAGQPGDQG